MLERLDQAAAIARATEAYVRAGNIEEAVEMPLDIEQPICEANTLLKAASLINRA